MVKRIKNKKFALVKQLFAAILLVSLLLTMLFFHKDNFALGVSFLLIPFVILFLTAVFIKPVFAFQTLFFANYFALGIARYIPGPLGLSIDGLLVLSWIALFFSQFNDKVPWKRMKNGLSLVAAIWFAYALFELINPEAVSKVAWFYAMRGVSLYMVLAIPLTFIFYNDKKYLDTFLHLWALFTLIAVAKGAMQLLIGPDPWEKHWLDVIGGKTHRLSQGLRVFSFFSDAATYGASMGYSGVVFSIIALHTKKFKKQIFWGIVAMAAFYAMLISGTRGAMAVPLAGYVLYAVLSKKLKILTLILIMGTASFSFLKYTTIGNSVSQVRRFRGALDPNNPSLLVREMNQKKLKVYLANRPFGGGIGSAGNWGLRFSPNTFLAKTPTDSWYVQIWAEQGWVGLTLHLSILFYVMFSSARVIMFKLKDPDLIGKGAALSAGIFGLMAASYGSGALGQMPNGIIVYMSMAFVFMMPKWEARGEN